MGFKIGRGSSIFMNVRFDCAKNLKIGNNCVINANCRLDNRGGLFIGENVSISEEVILLTADHDPDTDNLQGRSRKIIIEDYVWIGTRAMILPGATISKGTIVAAAAVVTKSTNEFDIVGGVPAKKIKERPRVQPNYKVGYKRLFQ